MSALTQSEGQVLDLLCDGLTIRQIWRRLYVTENTVKAHLNSIYGKLGVHNRNEAAIWGRANGYGKKEWGTATTSSPPFDKLRPRELEVVALVAQGKTNRQIASELGITPSTVKTHLENASKTLGEGNRQKIAKAYNEFQASKNPSS